MKKMFLFSLSIFAVFVIGGCSDSDRNKILGLSNDEVAYRFESNSSPNPSQQSLRSFDVQSTLHQESFEGFMTSISVFKDDKLSLKDFSVDLLNNIGEIDDTNNPENGWSYG
jgi:hypothetical protein